MRISRSTSAALFALAYIAVFTWFHCANAAPGLATTGTNPTLLCWPTNAAGFGLETATNCSPGTFWQAWPMQPAIIGTNYVATNTFSDSARYFRLSNWPLRSCDYHLQAIGVGFKIWAGDNQDRFPFHVPLQQGGTMELRQIGLDGFDANTFLHFQVISNELYATTALVCPADFSRQPASDFQSLLPQNVTYRLRTDDTVTEANPDVAMAVCPIDGNTLYCSGAVSNIYGY